MRERNERKEVETRLASRSLWATTTIVLMNRHVMNNPADDKYSLLHYMRNETNIPVESGILMPMGDR